MSTRNIKTLRYLALFVAILSFGAISSSNANAVSYDTYTDGDGVVWDRETTDDGDIYIGIKSVPSGVTTVNVPSNTTVRKISNILLIRSFLFPISMVW